MRHFGKSASSILSSGLTTVIGFLALLFMRFGIGPGFRKSVSQRNRNQFVDGIFVYAGNYSILLPLDG